MATKLATKTIAFLGGGNMATALARGLLEIGHAANRIKIAEPLGAKRSQLRRRYRVTTTPSNRDAVAGAHVVILAVKPQVIDDVLSEIRDVLDSRQLILSIAAGVKIAHIEHALGERARVVRVMPNTPCLVGRGAAVLCAGRNAGKADVAVARAIFSAVGVAHVVDKEQLMDAVTALSGSGPAYVYRFAEALIAHSQLPKELATELAYHTIAGAAEMMIRTGESPQALREAVSSPGGTTVAGLAALERAGFETAVADALEAAKRRSQELGQS